MTHFASLCDASSLERAVQASGSELRARLAAAREASGERSVSIGELTLTAEEERCLFNWAAGLTRGDVRTLMRSVECEVHFGALLVAAIARWRARFGSEGELYAAIDALFRGCDDAAAGDESAESDRQPDPNPESGDVLAVWSRQRHSPTFHYLFSGGSGPRSELAETLRKTFVVCRLRNALEIENGQHWLLTFSIQSGPTHGSLRTQLPAWLHHQDFEPRGIRLLAGTDPEAGDSLQSASFTTLWDRLQVAWAGRDADAAAAAVRSSDWLPDELAAPIGKLIEQSDRSATATDRGAATASASSPDRGASIAPATPNDLARPTDRIQAADPEPPAEERPADRAIRAVRLVVDARGDASFLITPWLPDVGDDAASEITLRIEDEPADPETRWVRGPRGEHTLRRRTPVVIPAENASPLVLLQWIGEAAYGSDDADIELADAFLPLFDDAQEFLVYGSDGNEIIDPESDWPVREPTRTILYADSLQPRWGDGESVDEAATRSGPGGYRILTLDRTAAAGFALRSGTEPVWQPSLASSGPSLDELTLSLHRFERIDAVRLICTPPADATPLPVRLCGQVAPWQPLPNSRAWVCDPLDLSGHSEPWAIRCRVRLRIERDDGLPRIRGTQRTIDLGPHVSGVFMPRRSRVGDDGRSTPTQWTHVGEAESVRCDELQNTQVRVFPPDLILGAASSQHPPKLTAGPHIVGRSTLEAIRRGKTEIQSLPGRGERLKIRRTVFNPQADEQRELTGPIIDRGLVDFAILPDDRNRPALDFWLMRRCELSRRHRVHLLYPEGIAEILPSQAADPERPAIVADGRRWHVTAEALARVGWPSRPLAVAISYDGQWVGGTWDDRWADRLDEVGCDPAADPQSNDRPRRIAAALRWFHLPLLQHRDLIGDFVHRHPIECLRAWLCEDSHEALRTEPEHGGGGTVHSLDTPHHWHAVVRDLFAFWIPTDRHVCQLARHYFNERKIRDWFDRGIRYDLRHAPLAFARLCARLQAGVTHLPIDLGRADQDHRTPQPWRECLHRLGEAHSRSDNSASLPDVAAAERMIEDTFRQHLWWRPGDRSHPESVEADRTRGNFARLCLFEAASAVVSTASGEELVTLGQVLQAACLEFAAAGQLAAPPQPPVSQPREPAVPASQ